MHLRSDRPIRLLIWGKGVRVHFEAMYQMLLIGIYRHYHLGLVEK